MEQEIASFDYTTRKTIYHAELESQVPDLAKLAVPPSEITIAEPLGEQGYRTLIADGWKLQVAGTPNKAWLFDLNADPTELHDLADAQSERLATMRAMLDAQNA